MCSARVDPRVAGRLRACLLALLMLVCGGCWTHLAAQPLPGGPPASVPGPGAMSDAMSGAEPAVWRGVLASALHSVRQAQLRLQRDLAGALRALKTSAAAGPALALGFLAFLYGVLHAAGPGHGKVVISSYLLADESQLRRGILLAFLSSAVQALSAIALVAVLALALDRSQLETSGGVRYLEMASYALLILVGLWLLAAALRGKACAHDHGGHACAHHHNHNHGQPHGAEARRSGFGRLTALVLAVGLRPCSGAVILLLFALAQGMFAVGVGATFAMAAGTAITVSGLAILTLASKRAALRLAGPGSVWAGRLHAGLSVAGALAIILFGALLLLAAAEQPAPL